MADNGAELVTNFRDGRDTLDLANELKCGARSVRVAGTIDALIELTAVGEDLAIVEVIDPSQLNALDLTGFPRRIQ